MDCLLDTHAFLWFINGDANLSPLAKQAIEDNSNHKFVSIVSIWEIAVKLGLGKLVLDFPFDEIKQYLLINNFDILPLSIEDIAYLPNLPFHHRDPFDRMLIAQALNRGYSIDQHFPLYEIPLIW